jgi:hypothetical protein
MGRASPVPPKSPAPNCMDPNRRGTSQTNTTTKKQRETKVQTACLFAGPGPAVGLSQLLLSRNPSKALPWGRHGSPEHKVGLEPTDSRGQHSTSTWWGLSGPVVAGPGARRVRRCGPRRPGPGPGPSTRWGLSGPAGPGPGACHTRQQPVRSAAAVTTCVLIAHAAQGIWHGLSNVLCSWPVHNVYKSKHNLLTT